MKNKGIKGRLTIRNVLLNGGKALTPTERDRFPYRHIIYRFKWGSSAIKTLNKTVIHKIFSRPSISLTLLLIKGVQAKSLGVRSMKGNTMIGGLRPTKNLQLVGKKFMVPSVRMSINRQIR